MSGGTRLGSGWDKAPGWNRHNRNGDVRRDPHKDRKRKRPGKRGMQDERTYKLQQEIWYAVKGDDDLLLHGGGDLRNARRHLAGEEIVEDGYRIAL
ncbi:hypothetical protein A9K68_030540 [Mesorhizobium sp. AA22]|nr:hypothetical protein A9K68_030540 [Mesorhizobium sp. AA22]